MCCDFPCCGHEAGCCPDFDEAGNQLNMKCTCGTILPVNNRYSICDACLNRDSDDPEDHRVNFDDEMDGDHESALESVYGPEDYGDFGYDGCHED